MFGLLRNIFKLNPRDDSVDESHENRASENAPTQLSSVSITLPLPEDLIIYILSYLSPEDLFNQCSFVEEWKSLISSQTLWSLKCRREGKALPKIRPNPLPDHFYRDLYFARFGENLLKNPCGQENLVHWSTTTDVVERYYRESTLQGWVIENPPQGADEVPDTSCQFCFATTHYWCRKSQVIDLWKEGFSPEVLEALKPKICVSEWYCARFDCGSEYDLDVKLLNNNKEVLDNYRFYHKENQWTGRAWSFTKHEFMDYPSSVRFINFTHSGKDTQFWAGSYGSKMAEGKVILEFHE